MVTNETVFERGLQIAYIPAHAEGKINHKDVEFGFITSLATNGNSAFCRYWFKDTSKGYVLRTVRNSEATYLRDLVPHDSVDRAVIVKLLETM